MRTAGLPKTTVPNWQYPIRVQDSTSRCARSFGRRIFKLLDAGDPGSESERRMIIVPLFFASVVGLAFLFRPWPFFRTTRESHPSNELTTERNLAVEFGKWVERQARARGLSVHGVARHVELECPKCHRSSNYFIYPDELCERCWCATLKPETTPVKDNRV